MRDASSVHRRKGKKSEKLIIKIKRRGKEEREEGGAVWFSPSGFFPAAALPVSSVLCPPRFGPRPPTRLAPRTLTSGGDERRWPAEEAQLQDRGVQEPCGARPQVRGADMEGPRARHPRDLQPQRQWPLLRGALQVGPHPRNPPRANHLTWPSPPFGLPRPVCFWSSDLCKFGQNCVCLG